jgi:putative ATP-dependent endonuclease of the OLD family
MLSLQLLDENHPGLGTLNRLFMAAELLHLSKDSWAGLRLGLIEELEAHLHPQAQMQIIDALRRQVDIQLIMTSHSPNLASKVKLENIILCSGRYAFPLGAGHTKLSPTDYPFLERFLDVTKANLFFAKGVVLVEGLSEELIVPALAKLLFRLGVIDKDFVESNVSVVAIHSIAFSRYANIFKRRHLPEMPINVSVITDLDFRPEEYAAKYRISQRDRMRHKIVDDSLLTMHIEQKLAKINFQNVRGFVSRHWTLEYCIALHPRLRWILFNAILCAIEEERADSYAGTNEAKMGIRQLDEKKIRNQWEKFVAGKTDSQIAFDLVDHYITGGRRLSKAVVAQHFSMLLPLSGEIVTNDLLFEGNSIQYIVDAILYAYGTPSTD